MKKVWYGLLLAASMAHADIFDSLGFGKLENTFNVVVGADKTRQDLGHLKTQLDLLQKEDRTAHEELHLQVEKVKAQINTLEASRAFEGQYKNKLKLVWQSILQLLTTIRSLRKEWVADIKQHINLLEEYIKDPELLSVSLDTKTLYTFEDIQALGNLIALQQERVEVDHAHKKETLLDLESAQKKLAVAEKAYKDKTKEQAEFGKGLQNSERFVRVKSELLDAEVLQAQYERDVLVLRVKEKDRKSVV